MKDFPVIPPVMVKDTPRPRRLTTLEEVRDYVVEAMRLGRLRLGAKCAINSWRKICCFRMASRNGIGGVRQGMKTHQRAFVDFMLTW